MKKAFTMLELIFVLVVIGILAAVILPQMKRDQLREAAIQVVSHVRYTQHLAMIDDKFDVNDASWYKKRWRFSFSKGALTNNKWSYTVWADTIGGTAGGPDPTEVAVNPSNASKRLTGGASIAGAIHTGDSDATGEMNIGQEYGVDTVAFSAPCRTAPVSKSIAFDHLGRPLRGALENYDSAYANSGIATNILVPSQCVITLTHDNGDTVQIAIEAETGYAHIL